MISRLRLFLIPTFRLTAAAACCAAIWCSWTIARADYLFRQDTESSVRRAVAMVPDAWGYDMRLAQLDPAHARELLLAAVRLNPYDAEADIELGLQYEAADDNLSAQQWLLRAFAVNRTYLPRWSLANFYLRRGNMNAFWTWARSAAEMPSDSTEALFEVCWRVSPDANEITRRIVNDDPKLIRQYLAFLLAKKQLQAAAGIANRLIQFGSPDSDTALMFLAIDQLVAAGDGDEAKMVWTNLNARHWIFADATFPNNPNFRREPLPVSFDWEIPSSFGCHSTPGPSGLETEFSGLEPERSTIAQQAIAFVPGNFEMEYSYRTDGIAPGTGLLWQIATVGSVTPLAESSDLSSETWTHAKIEFSIPPGISLAYLRLIYQRPLGTLPISGSLVLSSVKIQALR